MKKWARKFENCQICGETDNEHIGKGFCSRCGYFKKTGKALGLEKSISRSLMKKELDKETFEKLYEKLSMEDIAKKYNIGYDVILLHAKKIRVKTKRGPRNFNNFQRQKLSNIHSIYQVNNNFFSEWSNEMAWVLGAIYSDGNIKKVGNAFSISQKNSDVDFLEKILKVMNSNHKLYDKSNRPAKYFEINNFKMYHDLISLGLHSNKSKTITFPNVPNKYIRHFIRGLWDGDGSISYNNKTDLFYATFVSGSESFIVDFVNILKKYEIIKQDRKITKHKLGWFQISVNAKKDIVSLYKFLYDNVDMSLCHGRKYNSFSLIKCHPKYL